MTKLENLRDELCNLITTHALPKSRNCKIEFSNRMTTTLGRAWTKQFKIQLNAKVCLNDEEQLIKTFIHELAHLVAVEIYGYLGSGHGIHWQNIMRKFGQTPKRCSDNEHAKSLRKSQPVKLEVSCACGKVHKFKPITFKRLMSGTNYRCGKCHRQIKG